jgi:hypothetical protein
MKSAGIYSVINLHVWRDNGDCAGGFTGGNNGSWRRIQGFN